MRPSRATIDLDALRHNYRHARALGGGIGFALFLLADVNALDNIFLN